MAIKSKKNRHALCKKAVRAPVLVALLLTCVLSIAPDWGVTASVAAEAPGTRPNIVLIMTDDQGLRIPPEAMPNITRLIVDRGVSFNAFIENPMCCPSRATLVTGQYSQNTHVYSNNGRVDVNGRTYVGGYEPLRPSEGNALPVWLKAAGYNTAMIGKYVNGYSRQSKTYIPPGWDRWFAKAETGLLHYYNYNVNDQGEIRSFGAGADDYLTDVQAREVMSFLAEQAGQDKPFFLAFLPSAPHTEAYKDEHGKVYLSPPKPALRHEGRFAGVELPRPPSFDEEDVSDKPQYVRDLPRLSEADIAEARDQHQGRLESLLAVDDAVGNIFEELSRTGKLENTVFIFYSDNGYFLGEHRFVTGKRLGYEEAIRVPMAISGPGIPAGEARQQMVNNVDLVATIVDLAGAVPGRALDGHSLLPLIENPDMVWRSALLFQGLVQHWGPPEGVYRAVRTDRYKYIENELKGSRFEYELYDLVKDPWEMENLYGSEAHAGVAREMADTLKTLRDCSGQECWFDK